MEMLHLLPGKIQRTKRSCPENLRQDRFEKSFLKFSEIFEEFSEKKILKCPDQTNKSVKLHDKYLEEKQLNSEKRKLEKFEKQKAKKMESVLVKTSGEKVKFFISIPN